MGRIILNGETYFGGGGSANGIEAVASVNSATKTEGRVILSLNPTGLYRCVRDLQGQLVYQEILLTSGDVAIGDSQTLPTQENMVIFDTDTKEFKVSVEVSDGVYAWEPISQSAEAPEIIINTHDVGDPDNVAALATAIITGELEHPDKQRTVICTQEEYQNYFQTLVNGEYVDIPQLANYPHIEFYITE